MHVMERNYISIVLIQPFTVVQGGKYFMPSLEPEELALKMVV